MATRVEQPHVPAWQRGKVASWLVTVDHKRIGVLYIGTAGIFFAMLGAVYGTFEVYARTIYEPVRALAPGWSRNYRRLRLWNTIYGGVGALLILWTGRRAVTLATIVSPFSGVLGCGLWCLAMLAVDRLQMPEPYRMGRGLRLLTLLAGLTMAVIGGYVTYMSWRA